MAAVQQLTEMVAVEVMQTLVAAAVEDLHRITKGEMEGFQCLVAVVAVVLLGLPL